MAHASEATIHPIITNSFDEFETHFLLDCFQYFHLCELFKRGSVQFLHFFAKGIKELLLQHNNNNNNNNNNNKALLKSVTTEGTRSIAFFKRSQIMMEKKFLQVFANFTNLFLTSEKTLANNIW